MPGKHMVVSDEVDHSLLMESERDRLGLDASNGDIGALLKLKSEKHDEKEETWNKLTELSLFALSGFGFFETKLGTGTYNREKKARILRQGQTDKDWLWGNGLRVPISTRFAQGGSSLSWGCLSESTAQDDAILLGDCAPHTLDSYEAFATDGKKVGTHGKPPLTVDRFTRCAKQHIELFCLLYGKEHGKERMDALEIMIELHESQPDLFTTPFLCQTWEAMSFAYIAEVKDGTRRMIRMLPDVVKKTDLRRKALSPGPSGRVLWEYPTTWLMSNPTGYWQGSVKPKLEERVSRATWKTILSAGLKDRRGAGGEEQTDKPSLDQYPAGIPLPNEEIKASRAFRPLNGSGQALCWGYSSHAGCKAPSGQCTRGAHELMKLVGVHPLIKMHLARRGGHKSEKKIQVGDVDGHVQNLRSLLTAEELKYKGDKDKGEKWAPKAVGAVMKENAPLFKGTNDSTQVTDLAKELQPLPGKPSAKAWRATTLHADSDAFDFTPLESDTCALVNLPDDWARRPDEKIALAVLPSTTCDEQRIINEWWETLAPRMHTSIVPYVRNYMLTLGTSDTVPPQDSLMMDRCLAGLERLIKDGCKSDEQYARATLLLTKNPQDEVAGRCHIKVCWGEKTQCIDYTAQALKIGNLNFSTVDLGDSIVLPLTTQKALRAPAREENNQCVLLHLAAVGEWRNQGRPKRAPRKTRVSALASHFRQYGYQQARSFVTHIKKPSSQREYELWSVAHYAMMANHDRQFREIPAFLTGILNLGKCATLRIFEIEDSTHGGIVTVHQMGPTTDNPVEQDMALVAHKGHMGMLLTTTETTPKG